MRTLLTALLLSTAAVTGAHAAPYAPQEFDFSGLELDSVSYGTVESVREVLQPEFPAALADTFEHSVQGNQAAELVVRLDNGQVMTIVHQSLTGFRPGQRVRLVPQGRGLRIENA